eukprot:gnl/TRDRNA2_/TRDRNA2_82629_c0_seq2.p1 gnl/TRDRNA2_/TRDRNA2_82629_c0~~gnl/TRDRNA2_/TRDRNA2_82629_c0_seq2.p1  ORF type:complete len:381 (+),score=66.95 gnl/TRDRNA2_/TRDRNA2_82629_c0_seq2:92-1234(+)
MESITSQDMSKKDVEAALTDPRRSETKSSRCSFRDDQIAKDVQKTIGGSVTDASEIVTKMDLRKCFVEMQSYSKDKWGKPGTDMESEKLFMVYELGGESLADRLTHHKTEGTAFSVTELRAVQWTLVSIVCGLHAVGFVHLDIKPCNIIKFPCGWKLIDFDGAVKTQSQVPLEKIHCTPIYAAPEFASAIIKAKGNAHGSKSAVKVSRLMDVWSVGMCALEAVALEPVCGSLYEDWMSETGDDDKFLKWLADLESDPIISGEVLEILEGIDQDMSHMLQGMLVKDPGQRMCIPDCFVHPWFEPIRNELWRGYDRRDANGEEAKLSKSSPSPTSRRRSSMMAVAQSVSAAVRGGKQSRERRDSKGSNGETDLGGSKACSVQ